MNRVLLILLNFTIIILNAQPPQGSAPPLGRISGSVLDASNNEPLEYASVVMTNLNDSTKTYGVLVDDKGKFEISGIYPGAYKLVISFLGYQDQVQEKLLVVPPDKTDIHLGSIKMPENVKQLQDVEVTAEKSLMQLQADKKIFNVDKSALGAGGSATDVLKQIPTVDVDYQGNISVRGSGNLQVYINGRPSGITGANRQAILDAIPANTIESVELMNNPSAKYDAEGDAGIINIVLKKNTKGGFNGSFNMGYGTRYKFNTGFSLNYRGKKINLSTTYGARWNETRYSGYNTRKNIWGDTAFNFINTSDHSKMYSISNTFSANLDYYVNDKNTLSFNTLAGYSWANSNGTTYYDFLDSSMTQTDYSERSFDGPTKNWNTDWGINYRRTFKSNAQDLVISGTYSYSDYKDYSDYLQPIFLPDKTEQPVTPIAQHNLASNNNHIAQVQIDYTQPFEKAKSKLELGIKGSYRRLVNSFWADSLDRTSSQLIPDSGLINKFFYTEITDAAYGIYSGTYKKFGYKAGMRVEQWNITGIQEVGLQRNTRQYINFFPSAFLSQKFKKEHEMQMAYRRSINRPNPEQLNPFGDYNDPYNIRTGNPELLPVYTHTLEMSYLKNFKKVFLTTTVYYRDSKNIFTRNRYIDTNGVSKVVFANLDHGRSAGLEFVMRTQLTSWWNVMTNVNIFGNFVNGTVTSGEADQNINSFQWNFRIMSNMTVWKTGSLQVLVNFRSKMPFIQGEIKPFTFVNIGFKKDFLKNNKATLAINISDIFHTLKFSLHSAGEGFDGDLLRRWESTQMNLTFTYRFGKQDNKMAPPVKKKTNFDDNGPAIEIGG